MNELTIDDGQFMGHRLRRTQVFLGDRVFIAIPVKLDRAQGRSSDAPTPQQLRSSVGGIKSWVAAQQQAGLAVAPPISQSQHLLDAMASRASAMKVQPFPKLEVSASKLEKSVLQRVKDFMHLKPGKVHHVEASQADTYNVQMAGGVLDNLEVQPSMEQVPHPERSAYDHANVERAVPLIRLEAQPNFFLDDTVGMAMVSAIDSVCDTKHGAELGSDVRRMRAAVYRPLGMYKPDVGGPWTGDKDTSSLFFRQTIHLDKEWDLDIRHACGVYQAGGRSWLGVFIHGLAVRSGDTRVRRTGLLAPASRDEDEHYIYHRDARNPTGLFFDLFVPCEPEIVTEEWGWGADLEELTKARENNAARDAKQPSGTAAFPGNKWDEKSLAHKSSRQINEEQYKIDREARVLGERYMDALKERERARQVLYSYAWKALMLGVMECRLLTVEKY